MTFTAQNFRTEFLKIQNPSKELKQRFELANKSKPEDYENSTVVKRMIDLFVISLNQYHSYIFYCKN